MKKLAVLFLALLILGGCSGKHVDRVEIDSTIDLSGNWNDTDSRKVAEELIVQSINAAWISGYLMDNGKKPVLIIGPVRNKSSEHINTRTFIADLEKSYINSGQVKMVASSSEREAIRDERADQQSYSSAETVKQWGKESGADFMLIGEINSINDRDDGDEVKYYQVDVYLVDLEDNSKVWVGDKKIKKYVSRSGYKP
ncbi:MAG: penicillin-binding protein activator LpoB [bacterium]|nr:penicillin-binding protein activator LpoB [bacterium]MCP4798363.1 penicillin-binding protein activator LpoB [bacterium]